MYNTALFICNQEINSELKFCVWIGGVINFLVAVIDNNKKVFVSFKEIERHNEKSFRAFSNEYIMKIDNSNKNTSS